MIIGIDANEANQENLVGVGQFAFNVVSQLEKIDTKNQYIIYLKDKPVKTFPPERTGWNYKIFGPGKLWTQFALPIKLFTQREKLDIFFTPSHYASRFCPSPSVISIMDLWHHLHPEQFKKEDIYKLKKWEAYSVKRAKHIIAISEFTKAEIVRFYQYPEDKITVAYPGYTKFKVHPAAGGTKLKVEEIKKRYGINGDYLLYIGTLQPKKNIEGLIKAFSLLTTDHYPLITLVIAGKKGWLYGEIFELVKKLNLEEKVILTGFIDEEDKPYLLSGAQAFVFPSFYEGFGIPVLEAMSLGVPCVISKEGSLPEIGGDAAIYCDPYSIESIAEAMGKMLSLNQKQRNEIISAGKKQAEGFSWENCAKKILAVLEQVAKK